MLSCTIHTHTPLREKSTLTVLWDLSELGERTIEKTPSSLPEDTWSTKPFRHLASDSPASDLNNSISEA